MLPFHHRRLLGTRRSSILAAIGLGAAAPALGQNGYVANFADGTVSVLNNESFTVTGTPIPVGAGPSGLAATPDGTKLFVTNRLDGTVSVIATTTGTAIGAPIPVGAEPIAIAITPNGARAFVTNFADGTVSVIDVGADAVIGTPIPVGVHPAWLAITPDGTKAYVTSNGDGAITIIDTASAAAIGQPVPIGAGLEGIAITPDGANAFISADNGTVTEIETTTNTMIGDPIQVGNDPARLALSPDGSQLVVVNSRDATVSVIGISEGVFVEGTIPVGNDPQSVAFVPGSDFSEFAYVTNFADNTVSVVDVFQFTTTTITVGSGPANVTVAPAPSPLMAAVLPGSRSVQTGATATVFAMIENAGTEDLFGCQIGLSTPAPSGLTLDYQTTDPATNQPTGQPDTPAEIPAGGLQSFILSFASDTPFTATGYPLVFSCNGTTPAPVMAGVDRVDLTFSATPVPDVVALAATGSGDGILDVPLGSDGTGVGAFAVASVNVGSGDLITVSADTGLATLPLTLAICQTNPATSVCLAPPAATVTLQDAANAKPTFSIFAGATAPIAFAPESARLFIRFTGSDGAVHGETSVAVRTQ